MKFSVLAFLLLCTPVWAKWSVSTFNIRNFDNDPRAGRTDLVELTRVIQSVKSDVMAFEEVVNQDAFHALMKTALPGYNVEISSCGGFGKQKLAVVYDPKVFSFISKKEDMSFSGGQANSCGSLRPMFLVTLKELATKQNIVFGVVHFKAGGDAAAMKKRWVQYDRLAQLVKSRSKDTLVFLGDFNTTGYNIRNEDYTRFELLLSSSGLRTTSENLGCTSYWDGDSAPELASSILDHIVVQDKLMPSISRVELASHCAISECRPVMSDVLGRTYRSVSDHCPVRVSFK